MQKIYPCLWFDDQAEEAANFYISVFKNSKITTISRYGKAGSEASGVAEGKVMTVMFELDGQKYMGLNGGPIFKFSEAVSLVVNCENQEEIDYFWKALSEGGAESQCGWLKDKFGFSWQIVPMNMDKIMSDPDPVKTERAMKAMMGMHKLDIQKLIDAKEQQ